jgi:hypothetical protein
MKPIIIIHFIIIAGLFQLSFAQAQFSQAPSVNLNGSNAAISFSVTSSIDVEVGILDQSGKVIRHLAAGVLGGQYNPPSPLKPGLSQSLTWDLKDDYGNAVEGLFNVRVRLGIKPVFRQTVTTKVLVGTGYNYWASMTSAPQEYMEPTHTLMGKIKTHSCIALTMGVCDETDMIYFRVQKDRATSTLGLYNGLTGEFVRSFYVPFWITSKDPGWGEVEFSWDGTYIFHDEANQGVISRFTRDGVRAPYPGRSEVQGSNEFDPPQDWQWDAQSRGHAPGSDGSHYMMHVSKVGEYDKFAVSRIKDGKLVNSEIVRIDGSVGGGVKVDLNGNIYVGAKVKPKGQKLPQDVVGKLQGDILDKYSQTWWANDLYGSILKFPPSGGSVLVGSDGGYMAGRPDTPQGEQRTAATATNLEWLYFGLSQIANHVTWASECWCTVCRFDVDRYGRIFLPDAIQLEFRVIDNSRNEILRIKNRDLIVAHRFPIGLMHQIDATDKGVYVADHFNNQILIFDLNTEVESSVPLQVSIESGKSRVQLGRKVIDNYPNPFTPSTTISYAFNPNKKGRGRLSIAIYDIKNRLIRVLENSVKPYGMYTTVWDGMDSNGRPAAAGIYYVRVQMAKGIKQHKMILVK